MNAHARRFAQKMLARLEQLSYGELAVLAEWLYAAQPDTEKTPGMTWEIAHHAGMARLLDTKNYARMRALVARVEMQHSRERRVQIERYAAGM